MSEQQIIKINNNKWEREKIVLFVNLFLFQTFHFKATDEKKWPQK